MVILTSHLSIITVKANGLNSPIKRHAVAGWIPKTSPNYMLPPGESSQL